ncbi:MAG: MATE family efflux transporter [Candidatus Methanomethylophilaceae archaeon]|jgi:putative MATE family efflux protein|nr:MATE family efflux transporter [Candidatus Methanomethylophilaceae archaeon]
MSDNARAKKDVEKMLGNPRKAILAIALPVALALLLQNANNLVDALWVVGLGSDALSAIGLSHPLYSVTIAIGTGIGIGASSAIAWRIGKGEKGLADRTASQSVMTGLVVGLALTPVLLLVGEPVMLYMGGAPVMDLCLDYSYPLFLSSAATVMMGVLTGILRGEGSARRSMYMLLLSAGLNIILDPIFIYTFGWGISGAAWATVFSCIPAVMLPVFWYFVRKDMYLDPLLRGFRFDRSLQRDIMRVGAPEAMELCIMNLMNIFLNTYVIVAGGTDAMAVWSTVWRINYMLLIPVQAIASAVVPVCAASYGMRRFDRIREGYNHSLAVGIAFTAGLSLLLFLGAEQAATVFTYSGGAEDLRPAMAHFIRVCCLFMPTMAWVFIGSSLLQSMGKATYAMLSTLIRNVVLVLIFAYLATSGTDALWWGLLAGEVAGAALMGVWGRATLRALERKPLRTDTAA